MTSEMVAVEARTSEERDRRAPSRPYAVVHLVSQEAGKALLGPQVVDHMVHQAAVEGVDRPAKVVVGLLEAGRAAVSPPVRDGVAHLRARAPTLPIMLLPYVSRLGHRANALHIGRRIRRAVGDLPVVFHCRNEPAVDWAVALTPHVEEAAIVADIRGPWPEDLLYARGFDTLEEADAPTRRAYHAGMAHLHRALGESSMVSSVSRGMVAWLRELGVPEHRTLYVPCCVTATTFREQDRARVRDELGLGGKTVLACVVGADTRYQHLDDGVGPLVATMARHRDDVHLLCVAARAPAARAALVRAGVSERALTVLSLPQVEVAQYLSAADAGLLLKAPSRLNRFVQPVKLSEYLAAGLPVVVSPGTGSVDEMIATAGAGVVVDVFGRDAGALRREGARLYDWLRSDAEGMRERALRLCEREFVWSRYTRTVRQAYERALSDQFHPGEVIHEE